MTDKTVIPLPDTFRPIGTFADKVVNGLSARAAETLDREAQELEIQAALKRFTAEQIRKGAAR